MISLNPRDYFFSENNMQCLSFGVLDSRIILGSTFMRNHDILFNKPNNTVSIARSACSLSSSVAELQSYYKYHDDSMIKEYRRKKVDSKTSN